MKARWRSRAVVLSHLCDVPALANPLFPGLVDLVTSAWVRGTRRQELESAPAER